MNKLRQLFCRHEYEKLFVPHGYAIADGKDIHQWLYRCRKCGKQILPKRGENQVNLQRVQVNENRCICCGAPIPEGIMVCPKCNR